MTTRYNKVDQMQKLEVKFVFLVSDKQNSLAASEIRGRLSIFIVNCFPSQWTVFEMMDYLSMSSKLVNHTIFLFPPCIMPVQYIEGVRYNGGGGEYSVHWGGIFSTLGEYSVHWGNIQYTGGIS